jgi:hypothetical protein
MSTAECAHTDIDALEDYAIANPKGLLTPYPLFSDFRSHVTYVEPPQRDDLEERARDVEAEALQMCIHNALHRLQIGEGYGFVSDLQAQEHFDLVLADLESCGYSTRYYRQEFWKIIASRDRSVLKVADRHLGALGVL